MMTHRHGYCEHDRDRGHERNRKMRLKGIIVCVDYADVLAWTLPHNIRQFDELLVVTTGRDLHTRRLCEHLGVRRIETDVFYKGGVPFNKGAGINAGLRA